MNKQSINPPELGAAPRNYSHAVTLAGPAKLIYVSGQISLGPDGKVIGKGDVRKQCEQVLEHVTTVLRASGAGWGDVIKLNAYIGSLTKVAKSSSSSIMELQAPTRTSAMASWCQPCGETTSLPQGAST